MSLKPKTVRRLTLVAAVVVIAAAGVGGLVAAGQWQVHRIDARLRKSGLDAFARDDYGAAAQDLGDYLRRHGEDATALLAYAHARDVFKDMTAAGTYLL